MLTVMTNAKIPLIRKTIGQVIALNSPVQHRFAALDDSQPIPPLETGEVLLLCGAKGSDLLQSMGLVPKNRTIGSLRGKGIKHGQGFIYPTYDPGIVDRDIFRLMDIQWDAQLAIRRHNTGSEVPPIGDYQYVTDFTKVVNYVNAQYAKTGKPVKVACDLETVGLDEYNSQAWIISIFFTPKRGVSRGIAFTGLDDPRYPNHPYQGNEGLKLEIWNQINWLLTSPMVSLRGANFKYDLRWMKRKWGICCTNFKMDTTVVGSLLNENRLNGLNTHAKLCTPIGGYDDPFNAKHDKSRMDLALESDPEGFLTYAGGDTDAGYRVADTFLDELLQDKALSRFYVKLLHPALRAFEDIEETGVLMDHDYYFWPEPIYKEVLNEDGEPEKVLIRGLRAEIVQEVEKQQGLAIGQMPKRLQYKHWGKLKLSRADLIIDYMFTPLGLNLKPKVYTKGGKTGDEKKKKPSTSIKDHLNQFSHVEEAAQFISHLKAHNSATKTLSTYVDGFFSHYREDGRFHPHYVLYKGSMGDDDGDEGSGTNTGRTAARDPAVQCGRGSNIIYCKDGKMELVSVVEGFESGKEYQVKTHTGKWKRVIGVCRNGIQPVFEVTTHSGLVTGCTANHPLLLNEGFVRTDNTRVGDLVYTDGEWNGPNSEERFDRASIPQAHCARPQEGQWENPVGMPMPVREPEAGGVSGLTGGADSLCAGVGQTHGARYESVLSSSSRVDRGGGVIDAKRAEEAGYILDPIVSIHYIGDEETYDITVEEDHSFVADGIVVHNTIPKHTIWAKKLRRGYIAPEGYVIVNWDYSQGELRIAACLANEPTMIKLYRQGIDLHMITGGKLNGYSESDMLEMKEAAHYDKEAKKLFKKLRQGGKAGNFGLLYGMSAGGYQQYALLTYGVHLTDKEALTQREAFFDLYPGLVGYHKEYKARAHRDGFIRSPLGRIRHLPLINGADREQVAASERYSINSPVQATLSDLGIYSVAQFKKHYGTPAGCQMFMDTHDALTAYVKKGEIGIWVPRVKDIMENLPLEEEFQWTPQLTFDVDFEISALNTVTGNMNLADLIECEGGIIPQEYLALALAS